MARPSTRARCSFALNRAMGTNWAKPRTFIVFSYLESKNNFYIYWYFLVFLASYLTEQRFWCATGQSREQRMSRLAVSRDTRSLTLARG